jgi:hypothetical protein
LMSTVADMRGPTACWFLWWPMAVCWRVLLDPYLTSHCRTVSVLWGLLSPCSGDLRCKCDDVPCCLGFCGWKLVGIFQLLIVSWHVMCSECL